MLQQPARSDHVLCPTEEVAQRRHAARDAVGIELEALQQLERFEVTAARSDVRRYAVGRIGATLQENFRER